MNKYVIPLLLALSPILIGAIMLSTQQKVEIPAEKLYVALEEEGKVAVIDTSSNTLMKTITINDTVDGRTQVYMAHNVQVTPDGNAVLVTANAHGMDSANAPFDKLFVLDPLTDTIRASIPLVQDGHLAHVVSDGNIAYVSSQEQGTVIAVDLNTNTILRTYDLGADSQPHGLRLHPDGIRLFVAQLGQSGISTINLADHSIVHTPIPGKAVQVAVTPDGTYVFASMFDTKQIAWVRLGTEEQGYIALPEGAQGPIQLYPSPDSRYLYVADQGYYFGAPIGNSVYRIAVAQKQIDQQVQAGEAPHGVVVNQRGTYTYITNLLSGDVTVIDTFTGAVMATIPVGPMPNGISLWHRDSGGTP